MKNPFQDLFIFEMANNHQGSVHHGLRIIREMGEVARKHGIRAGVKLQYRDLDTFIHPDYAARTDVKHIPRFLETRLSEAEFRTLVEATRDEGLTTMVTPFDERSVQRCIDHGVEILKVASCSALDWPLLEVVAGTGRPVIVSTGGLCLEEIDQIISFFTHKHSIFALMHCVALYPTPRDAVQMGLLSRMQKRYPGIAVGYSGHEAPGDLDVVKGAVSKGARLLERHVGVPAGEITLNAYSMNPDQADAWVEAALETAVLCSDRSERRVSGTEIESLQSLKRGVYAVRNVQSGETLDRDDVYFAMPCADGQLSSGDFGRYRTTYTASRDYAADEPVSERVGHDAISRIRGIVHEAKGLLFEAQIPVGEDFEIELSHHYGLEEFRRTGAVLITVVNRTYCKKLIVVFQGQSHPTHWHNNKEETFQILWGSLALNVYGQRMELGPGQTVLIHPGERHSFTSETGAIFEEISTTHQRSDTRYEDDAINRMDVLERKTILESW
jgi:sialic acid synthase SpsE/mannose-6-phosphate isomerase-like protein (cupin superfamily)